MNKTDFSAVQEVISKLAHHVASLDSEAEALTHQVARLRAESKAANESLSGVIHDYNDQLFNRLDKSENLNAFSSLRIPTLFRVDHLLVDSVEDGEVMVTTVPELNEHLKPAD